MNWNQKQCHQNYTINSKESFQIKATAAAIIRSSQPFIAHYRARAIPMIRDTAGCWDGRGKHVLLVMKEIVRVCLHYRLGLG